MTPVDIYINHESRPTFRPHGDRAARVRIPDDVTLDPATDRAYVGDPPRAWTAGSVWLSARCGMFGFVLADERRTARRAAPEPEPVAVPPVRRGPRRARDDGRGIPAGSIHTADPDWVGESP